MTDFINVKFELAQSKSLPLSYRAVMARGRAPRLAGELMLFIPISGKRLRRATFRSRVASGAVASRFLNIGRDPAIPPPRSSGIIENVSDAIIATDESQRIVLANASAAAMFSTTVAEMHGSSLSRFISTGAKLLAGCPAPNVSAWSSAGRRGRPGTDYAITGLRASGKTFPDEGSVSSSIENGEALCTIMLRDVTERQQVQEKLSRSHAQLRELSTALQTIQEEERTHIARELHDDLGQLRASLRMDLTLLQQQPGASADALRLMKGMEDCLLTAITSSPTPAHRRGSRDCGICGQADTSRSASITSLVQNQEPVRERQANSSDEYTK